MPSNVFDHNEAYRRQLSRFPEFHHALWRPYEETVAEEEIAVGDVGYFLEGEFIRLLKAETTMTAGSPDFNVRRYLFLTDQQSLRSANIRDVKGSGQAGAG